MKKLLLLLMSFCLFTNAKATDVIVGTGTGADYNLPYGNYYKYSTEEFLYTASEIPAGKIDGISFYVNTASSLSATINIYLGYTSNSTLSSYIYSGFTRVYSGTRTLGSSTGWEKIPLSTPFIYDGSRNLVMIVTKSCSSYNSSLTYRYSTGAGTGFFRYNDNYTAYATYSNTSYSFSTTTDRPNTRFSYSSIGISASSKYDFTTDNMFYNVVSLNDLTCELTRGDNYTQTSMTIPSTVDFSGKTMTVTGINRCAINNAYLTDLQLSESIQNIGNGAFYGCFSLKSLTIPEKVTEIPDSMAMYCFAINSLSLGNNTTTIGKYAFGSCSSLTNIDIPSTVTQIGDYAFNGCSGVSQLTIGDSKTTLALGKNGSYGAFYGLPIQTLYIGKKLSYDTSNAQYAPFYSNTTLKNLTIGNEVTEFPDASLATKTSLTELYIGDGLKEMPSFNTCTNLKKLTLGAGLTSVPTFAACEKIDTIFLRSTTPQAAQEFSNKIYVNCVLKVPTGSLAAYQAADVWKNFWLMSEYDVQSGIDATPGIRISKPTLRIREGETETLTAKLFPGNTLCENLQWKSDNSAVATVSQAGVVTAVKEGTAHIVALTTDGSNYTDTCLVTVRPPYDLGDVNDDGSINVADVSGVVNFILDTNTDELLFRAADMNKDNRILVDDLSDIITMVMNGATVGQAKSMAMSKAFQNNSNYISMTQGDAANEITMRFAEKNNEYSGLQFDLTLPDGYAIEDITISDNQDVQLVQNRLANNDVRVMMYSPSNSLIGVDDNILSIKLAKLTDGTDNVITAHNVVATNCYAKATSLGAIHFEIPEATNVSFVNASVAKDKAIYNLMGQKVNAKKKGIYIYNGKKFINK